MQPLISVIIPTYKRPASIHDLLADLSRQTILITQFEILVIDNNSGDNTAAVVQEFANQYQGNVFYYQQQKKGAAAARNLGIAKARSEIILFLDDDMSAAPRLIAEHLKTHEKQPGEAICVLGWFETAWRKQEDIFLQFLQKSEMQNDWPSESDEPVSFRYFYTGNISVATSAVKKVSGFDENFTSYGVEDIDLGYRLSAQGTKIYFNKQALCFHNYNPEFKDFLKKREQAGSSLGYFLYKYPHLRKYFSFGKLPWIFLGCGRLVFFIFGPLVRLNKKKLTLALYYYFRVLLRWRMYKSLFLYSWKKKQSARNSLPNFLR